MEKTINRCQHLNDTDYLTNTLKHIKIFLQAIVNILDVNIKVENLNKEKIQRRTNGNFRTQKYNNKSANKKGKQFF